MPQASQAELALDGPLVEGAQAVPGVDVGRAVDGATAWEPPPADLGTHTSQGLPPQAPSSAAQAQQQARAPISLTQSQRDALIAEVLGDVGQLSQEVRVLGTQMQTLSQLLNVDDYKRWRQTLDAKLQELSSIHLSEHASSRLQVHAQDYLGALAKQVDLLVSTTVQQRVAETLTFTRLFDRLQRDWLMRLGHITAAAFLGTLLALVVWRLW